MPLDLEKYTLLFKLLLISFVDISMKYLNYDQSCLKMIRILYANT